jgi:hypothetical protein
MSHHENDNSDAINPDPIKNAKRIIEDATAGRCHRPGDEEVAWLAWSAHIQDADTRDMTLLLAAFGAGFYAARGPV